jgi:ABC-type lipoprotein export system ATPase subunit
MIFMKLPQDLQQRLRTSFEHDYAKDTDMFLADVRTSLSQPVVSAAHSTAQRKPTGDVLIEIHGVTKQHQLHKKGEMIQALRGVDLQIHTGEILACIGPSGSGKSTLMHLIGGLDTPTSGEVKVNGIALNTMKDRELSTYRNETVGFVFQFFYLQPYLNVQQNVEIPLMFRGETKAKRQEAAQAAIEAVGLKDRLLHLPHQLSGGQMQRVAIARALVNQPKILLADEPTGNLDKATGGEIIALLEQINRDHGTTIVIVTHDPAVAHHAHRVVTLSDGNIVSHI